jgi:hypothetical protein
MGRKEVRLHMVGAFLNAAEERADGDLHMVDILDDLVGEVSFQIAVTSSSGLRCGA